MGLGHARWVSRCTEEELILVGVIRYESRREADPADSVPVGVCSSEWQLFVALVQIELFWWQIWKERSISGYSRWFGLDFWCWVGVIHLASKNREDPKRVEIILSDFVRITSELHIILEWIDIAKLRIACFLTLAPLSEKSQNKFIKSIHANSWLMGTDPLLN